MLEYIERQNYVEWPILGEKCIDRLGVIKIDGRCKVDPIAMLFDDRIHDPDRFCASDRFQVPRCSAYASTHIVEPIAVGYQRHNVVTDVGVVILRSVHEVPLPSSQRYAQTRNSKTPEQGLAQAVLEFAKT